MTEYAVAGISSAAFSRCAPFALFIALLALGSLVEEPWLVVARNIAVGGLLVFYWPRYVELHGTAPARFFHWPAAVACGFAVFIAWTMLDHDMIVVTRSSGFAPVLPDGRIDWWLALLRLAGFALVVPIMEELFWRGFLLRWLERQDFLSVPPSQVGLRAVLITSVLFALEHNQWLAGAVASVVYSVLYIRSGSLWVPVAAHALTNLALGTWILWTRNWQFW